MSKRNMLDGVSLASNCFSVLIIFALLSQIASRIIKPEIQNDRRQLFLHRKLRNIFLFLPKRFNSPITVVQFVISLALLYAAHSNKRDESIFP